MKVMSFSLNRFEAITTVERQIFKLGIEDLGQNRVHLQLSPTDTNRKSSLPISPLRERYLGSNTSSLEFYCYPSASTCSTPTLPLREKDLGMIVCL
jgi:hypothetical protein